MVHEQYLSYPTACLMAERISAKTMLTTEVFPYESRNQWFYVAVYDVEGRVVDTIDDANDALDLIRSYKKD